MPGEFVTANEYSGHVQSEKHENYEGNNFSQLEIVLVSGIEIAPGKVKQIMLTNIETHSTHYHLQKSLRFRKDKRRRGAIPAAAKG